MTSAAKSLLLLTFPDDQGGMNCVNLAGADIAISLKYADPAGPFLKAVEDTHLSHEIKALRASLSEAAEALEFYGYEGNYKSGKRGIRSKIHADHGALARDTLKIISNEGNETC